MLALYDDLPWLAASSVLWHQVLLVDRSILEHLLKTEQIVAIRWRMSTLQRDRLMANSSQLGGGNAAETTVIRCLTGSARTICHSEAPVKRVATWLAPDTVSARIAAEVESGAYLQVVGKTEFVTTGLWRPTCPKRNGRSGYLKEAGK